MKKLLLLVVLLTACGAQTEPPVAQRNDVAPGTCQTIYTFDSQDFLQYCAAALGEPTETPVADTPTATETDTPVPSPTDTPVPSDTPASTPTPATPFPSAPLCPDHGSEHDTSQFHTLWNGAAACHYDHEHGTSPFTADVAAAFPGFDLPVLLGGVEIGHTNPSSPVENVTKHGGFKWQVDLAAPNGCAVGFEGGTVAVDAYAIQYHAFGPQSVEFEARNHSAAALLRQCKAGNPSDKGYVYVTTLQEYGQRIAPYQGQLLPYPDTFQPTYATNFGPYFTTECYGAATGCRPSLAFYGQPNANNLTVWTSKRTGPVSQPRPAVPLLFRLLFRGRDAYQSLDVSDLAYPFTYAWACGGAGYTPSGCRYNNSTITIHEIAGDIPTSWDNLAGWDTDNRTGRVTVDGYITNAGQPAAVCEAPGTTCYVVQAVGAFVGRYSSDLCAVKCGPPDVNMPERDIYFCGSVVCAETDASAVPSGWIADAN